MISEQLCPWTGAGEDWRCLTDSCFCINCWFFNQSINESIRPNALFSLLSAAEQQEAHPYCTSFSHFKAENVKFITWNLLIPPLQTALPFSIAICLLPSAFHPSCCLSFFSKNTYAHMPKCPEAVSGATHINPSSIKYISNFNSTTYRIYFYQLNIRRLWWYNIVSMNYSSSEVEMKAVLTSVKLLNLDIQKG